MFGAAPRTAPAAVSRAQVAEPQRGRSGELRTEAAEIALNIPTPDLLGGCCEGTDILTLEKAGKPRVGGYSSREEEGLCQGTGKTVVSAEESTRPQHRAGKEPPQEGEDQTGLEDQIYQDIICLNTCCILYIFNTVIKV